MTIQDLALFGKALAEPARVRILAILRVGELCVCEIGHALELTQSTLSSHLQTLRQSGLVETRKNGKWVYYTLASSRLRFLESFFELGTRVFERDKRMAADARRLRKRLSLRENGCCVLGFDEPIRKGGEKK